LALFILSFIAFQEEIYYELGQIALLWPPMFQKLAILAPFVSK
jgi:hypothetical protein